MTLPTARAVPTASYMLARPRGGAAIASARAQQDPALNDGTRIGRSAVPKAPEFQELYDFDAAAKTLGDATFPCEVGASRPCA